MVSPWMEENGNRKADAFNELKGSVHAALETYTNVHRGSGHNSIVTTQFYEQARDIVLEYLGLNKEQFVVIFCTPRRAQLLTAKLDPASYQCLSSADIGLPLGLRALAVACKALPGGPPFQPGGGTARLVSPDWVIWARSPDKFEAGTSAIVNVIAFAKALRLIQHFGKDALLADAGDTITADEILDHDILEDYSGRALLDQFRQTWIGRGVLVPTLEGSRPFINLDNGASTPTFMPIWEAVFRTWRQPGHVQENIISEVKSICANFLGAPLETYDMIFTSNTTEAINLAAESLRKESVQSTNTVVLNTIMEHNSNELPWRLSSGVSMIRMNIDEEGFIDLKELESLLSAYNQENQHGNKRIRLVAVSGASNVLGVFNDLAGISRIVHQYGAHLLVDGAQMVAHRKVDMAALDLDYLAFSAHKVYAPFGSGVLAARKGLLKFSPAEMEIIRSSGEENAGGIAGLGKALLLIQRIGLDLIQEEEQVLTGQALRGLAQVPGLTIYGIKDPDSPEFAHKGGVILFGLKDILAKPVARDLAERGGIGVRSGCHCAHMLIKRLIKINPFLERLQGLMLMLFPKLSLPGLVRISLGIENSQADIDTLIRVLEMIARQPRSGMKSSSSAKRTGSSSLTNEDFQRQMEAFTGNASRRVYSNSLESPSTTSDGRGRKY